MDEMRLDGMGVAPGVLETIAVQAASAVEGVASVDGGGLAGLVAKGQGRAKGVEVRMSEDGLEVDVHLSLAYGRPLHETAREVQEAVTEALQGMTDQAVKSVDVYVDQVVFKE
ncbi:MAG: hypothetical protein Kow0056_00610 [Coriobacteriia bacterium]